MLARRELVACHRQPVVAGDEAFGFQVELEIDELEVEAQDEARRGAGRRDGNDFGVAVDAIGDARAQRDAAVLAAGDVGGGPVGRRVRAGQHAKAIPAPDPGQLRLVGLGGGIAGVERAARREADQMHAELLLAGRAVEFVGPVAALVVRWRRAAGVGLGGILRRPLERDRGRVVGRALDVVDLDPEQEIADRLIDRNLVGRRIEDVGRRLGAAKPDPKQRVADLGVARVGLDGQLGRQPSRRALDLQHRLRARAGIGAVEAGVLEPRILEEADLALPGIDVDQITGRDRAGRRWKVWLGGVGEHRVAGFAQPHRQAARVEHAGHDLERRSGELHAERPAARHAAADHVAQRFVESRLDDRLQLVPVGVGDHPALLLEHAGVPLGGVVAVSRDLALHDRLLRVGGGKFSLGSGMITAIWPTGR